MSKKSRQAKTQNRYRSAMPVADILADLLAKNTLPAQNPQYLRYHALLLAAIPAQWHGDIRIGKLQYQGFEIHAVDSALAYRLKFLAPEIRAALGKTLPHAPPIVVKVDPALKQWQSHAKPKSLPAPRERLSDRQADDILDAFFARTRKNTADPHHDL